MLSRLVITFLPKSKRLLISWLQSPSALFRSGLNQIPYDNTVEMRNRFKGLDLKDRVPEELWMEVHDIVQEAVMKKNKCKKAKWLSDKALQIAGKIIKVKGKGEKERYPFECRVPKNS